MLLPLTQQFRPSGSTLEKPFAPPRGRGSSGRGAGQVQRIGTALRAQEIREGFLEEAAQEPGLEGPARCEGQVLDGPWASSGSFHGAVDGELTVKNCSWIS